MILRTYERSYISKTFFHVLEMKESKRNGSLQVSPSEVKIEVYRHYQELARNEDRLFNERLMLMLVGHSILFAGYLMSFESLDLFIIRVTLSIIGIFLSVLNSLFLAYPAKKAWEIWMSKLEEIEENIKEPGLTMPYEVRKELGNWGKFPWTVGCWLLPSLFFILWVVSLIFGS